MDESDPATPRALAHDLRDALARCASRLLARAHVPACQCSACAVPRRVDADPEVAIPVDEFRAALGIPLLTPPGYRESPDDLMLMNYPVGDEVRRRHVREIRRTVTVYETLPVPRRGAFDPVEYIPAAHVPAFKKLMSEWLQQRYRDIVAAEPDVPHVVVVPAQ